MAAPSYESVLEQTITFIRPFVEDVEVNPESRFAEDLSLDSVEVMDLVDQIEEHYDINIPLNWLPEMTTVGETAKRLVQLLEESK